FELGARLATHPTVPLSIINERPPEASAARSTLFKLLQPRIYERAEERPQFIGIVDEYLEQKAARRNHVFEVASHFFESRQERYRVRVDERLSEEASATVTDGDPLDIVEVDVLYARADHELGRQVTRSSFERLCAAWCYLDEREAPHTWKETALLGPSALTIFNRYRDLSARLRSALETRYSQADQRLLERIRERQKATAKLAQLSDGLNEWGHIRLDIDAGSFPDEE